MSYVALLLPQRPRMSQNQLLGLRNCYPRRNGLLSSPMEPRSIRRNQSTNRNQTVHRNQTLRENRNASRHRTLRQNPSASQHLLRGRPQHPHHGPPQDQSPRTGRRHLQHDTPGRLVDR